MDAQQDNQDISKAEAFLRSVTWAEEDRHKFTTAPWRGEYRWFRSGNVVCIEKARLWLKRNNETAAYRRVSKKRPPDRRFPINRRR
jgi:hypothetical protein